MTRGAGRGAYGDPMHVVLVHAAFPRTYWGFQHALAVTGKRATLPPLGLLTVAAHLPRAWELRLRDLNVEALTDADLAWADAVLVGGMLVQAPSMHEVLARARLAGKRTIVGGPAASTSPALFAADVVFRGEVEGRERELHDAITGEARAHDDASASAPVTASDPHRPDLGAARVPRFDLLRLDAYTTMAVQTSRGCPYHCEFCDVIELFGRVPRVKAPAQVTAELAALHRAGWRGPVFVVDDNFIGNLKLARALLPAIEAWQRAHDGGFELYTEASVNLANDPALLAALVAAANITVGHPVGTCAAGQAVVAVNFDGTVVCGACASQRVIRYNVFDTYLEACCWNADNNPNLYGGVNPSSWTDGNAFASDMSSDAETLRTLFNRKIYPGKNALVSSQRWMDGSSTNGKVTVALLRIRNTTGGPIDWTPQFYFTAFWGWAERASVALNGVNVWNTEGDYGSNSTAAVTLTIPADSTSTAIWVVPSSPFWNAGAHGDQYHRMTMLAFYNDSLDLPPGLELVDDLDQVNGNLW